MRVHDRDGPDTTSGVASDVAFSVRRGQRFSMGVLVLLMAALVVLLGIDFAKKRVDVPEFFSVTVGASSNVSVTQNKAVDFALEFEKWLGGSITKDDLEAERKLLAKQLLERDNTGIASGDRFGAGFFHALSGLDGYIAEAPPGYLPLPDQITLRPESRGTRRAFIYEARQPALDISNSADAQIYSLFQTEMTRLRSQNVAIPTLIVLIFALGGFLAFSRFRDFRRVRARMALERRKLDETNVALEHADTELQMRLEMERVERVEQEWIDTEFRTISARLKRTIVPDEIAEALVGGLGQALGADTVISYSFAQLPWPRLVTQWHRRTDTFVAESLFVDFESRLFTFVNRLWSDERVIVVTDSHDVNLMLDRVPDPDRIPELVALTRERARSWTIVPFGDGLHVMGFVLAAMIDDARVWSSAEISLIRKVVSDVANVFVHARLFRQTMLVTENAHEVRRLVELDKVKSDFIENMNHELRSPLTSIIGYMEVILDDVDSDVDPGLFSSLTTVQRNALRLQSLIENMMQLSKADFEQVSMEIVEVDIGHLLGDVAKSMELGADDSGVTMTLRLDSPASDLLIDGDINQLERVFINLVSNAIKFTPRGGTVTISVRRVTAAGEFVEVKVADTGIGIPPEEFPNVFKRFFRASTATQESIPGFGIGLSLVQSIVREHHGTITFDSAVGKGTVFAVTLPTRFNDPIQ